MNWLLDKALRSYVKEGEISLVDHDGKTSRYGSPGGFGSVEVRFTDSAVARDILRDPGLGAAEAYMDGRLIVERGEILDLVNIIRGSHRWEESEGPNPFLRKGSRLGHKLRTLNWKPRALRNVSHHYDVGNDFYRLSSIPTSSTAAAISPIPPIASTKPSSTRKRTSPPSSGSSRA